MHRIWQTHHKFPHEVYALESRHRAFIYASETIAIEAEEKARKDAARK